MPKKFEKKLLIQVSHYAPEEIILIGEAGFADIMLDLPRLNNESYKTLLEDAQKIMKAKDDSVDKLAKSKSLTPTFQVIICFKHYILY
jgi:hypothetical protein